MQARLAFLEFLFHNISRIFAIAIILTAALIAVMLYSEASEAIKAFGVNFLFTEKWAPNVEKFGAAGAIISSLVTTFLSMLLALPIALGIAAYLALIAPRRVKDALGSLVELLAAIPSVIYGMWGLFFLAPILREIFGGNGFGLLTASIVLAIMILPLIASVSRDAIETVPEIMKESAYALGATTFDCVRSVIFPYAKTAIVGAAILALGRAIGETMAAAFVIGSVHKIPENLLSTGASIPVVLANEFTEADSAIYTSSLFYLALILFVMSFSLITIAKLLLIRKQK
ncbi:MAG: phosphate ABC transporter permease subunit PstC [Helicobacteraceae bacterium]|jgi:phosphate transport system permease protein|nr:phosphate ABC transporter permease subunit PstC [Helicobacteraceae bacterium]